MKEGRTDIPADGLRDGREGGRTYVYILLGYFTC